MSRNKQIFAGFSKRIFHLETREMFIRLIYVLYIPGICHLFDNIWCIPDRYTYTCHMTLYVIWQVYTCYMTCIALYTTSIIIVIQEVYTKHIPIILHDHLLVSSSVSLSISNISILSKTIITWCDRKNLHQDAKNTACCIERHSVGGCIMIWENHKEIN